MSVVSELVKIPYRMQPGMQKIALSDIVLHAEPTPKPDMQVKLVSRSRLRPEDESDVFYSLLQHILRKDLDWALAQELYNPAFLTKLEFLHKMMREDIVGSSTRRASSTSCWSATRPAGRPRSTWA